MRPTTAVEPGEWVAVDGVIESVADAHETARVPAAETLQPDPPRPSGTPGVDFETPPDPPERARSLFGDVPDPAIVAYAVERLQDSERLVEFDRHGDGDVLVRWLRAFQGVASVPFRLADDAGSVRVAPPSVTAGPKTVFVQATQPEWFARDGVRADATRATFESFPVVDSAVESDTAGPEVAAFATTALEEAPERLTLRYRERALGEGDAVSVLGWATERDGDTVITAPGPGGTFLVSAG